MESEVVAGHGLQDERSIEDGEDRRSRMLNENEIGSFLRVQQGDLGGSYNIAGPLGEVALE